MKNLSNVLVEVLEWQGLGVKLDIKRYKLEEINRNNHGNVPLCKMALIDLWLRGDIKASWEKLAEALTEMGEADTVEKIRTTYLLGGGNQPQRCQLEFICGYCTYAELKMRII